MPSIYEVLEGDCCSSIAATHGFAWDTIWRHASNEALRAKRPDPNILVAGDRLAIPDRLAGSRQGATGQRHVFHLKCIPLFFCLKLRAVDGSLLADAPYQLSIAGAVVAEGLTDPDGGVRLAIPPSALEGELKVGPADAQATYQLSFGALPPIDSIRGLKARLNNLGYDCGLIDEIFDQETRAALRLFQATSGLDATGYPDEATMGHLQALHDAFDEGDTLAPQAAAG
jgi:hypothetical protein